MTMDKTFRKYLARFGGLGSRSKPFLIYQTTTINQKLILMSLWLFTLLKLCTEALKNSKHDLLKTKRNNGKRNLYCAIMSIVKSQNVEF